MSEVAVEQGVGQKVEFVVASEAEIQKAAAIQEGLRLKSEGAPVGPNPYPFKNNDEGLMGIMGKLEGLANRWRTMQGDFANRGQAERALSTTKGEVYLDLLPVGSRVFVTGDYRTEGYCFQIVESGSPDVPKLVRVSNLGRPYHFLGPIGLVNSLDPNQGVVYPRTIKTGSALYVPYFKETNDSRTNEGAWGAGVRSVAVVPPSKNTSAK